MDFESDKFLNRIAGDEFTESDPETRLKNYFEEMKLVNTVCMEGATVFIVDPQLLEANAGLADIVIPEEVEKFQHVFAELFVGMQAEQEMSLTEMVQRALTGQIMSLHEKARNAVLALVHGTQQMIERIQASQLAVQPVKNGRSR